MIDMSVEPKDLWQYYLGKKSALSSTMFEIARNDEYGIVIYLSENNYAKPTIVVEADAVEVYSEVIVGEHDAAQTCAKIYETYLSSKVVSVIAEREDDGEPESHEDAIANREAELDDAVLMFLSMVLSEDSDAYDGDLYEDVKDHFLEYLARKWELPIYRPMMLEDENGEDFYTEFPYEQLIFEDEDNPIYK